MKLKLTESELRAVIKSLKEIKRLSVIKEKNYREKTKKEREKYDKAMFKKDITKRDGFGSQEDKEIYLEQLLFIDASIFEGVAGADKRSAFAVSLAVDIAFLRAKK